MLQLARSRSAAFIADELVCSPATVRTHMKNIYAKLGVHWRRSSSTCSPTEGGARIEGNAGDVESAGVRSCERLEAKPLTSACLRRP